MPEGQRASTPKENAMADKETTIPSFNPSGKSEVDAIKEMTETLMQYLRDNVPDNRCRSIALTNFEQAAMWAVKANFT
jgi:hypothetical protein